jgi:hypothetical protein
MDNEVYGSVQEVYAYCMPKVKIRHGFHIHIYTLCMKKFENKGFKERCIKSKNP